MFDQRLTTVDKRLIKFIKLDHEYVIQDCRVLILIKESLQGRDARFEKITHICFSTQLQNCYQEVFY